jgi:hypothetical protein
MRRRGPRRHREAEPGAAVAPTTADAVLDMARRSTTARGYGSRHQRLRAYWHPLVQAGQVSCARCGNPIKPGEPWHLDHDDDRRRYLGPSHSACNIAAGGRAARARRASPKPKRVTKW